MGLPLLRSALTHVHLARVDDTWSRRRGGAVVHQRVRGAPTPVGGSVTVAVAAVQVGLSCGAESALIAADAALHRGLMSPGELEEAIALMRSFAGIGPVRAALGIADARIESPGESRTHFLLHHLGLPVELQVLIRDGSFAARVDFEVVGLPVIVEFDGRVKYSDPQVLYDEKTREDRLRELGYEFVRLTWADLADPVGAKRKIMRAVARAKARQTPSTHPRAGY